MTVTRVIALPRFIAGAQRIAEYLGGEVREYGPGIFAEAFREADRIVVLMSMGIAVRKIAPLLEDKWKDPAVVVVSPDFRYAIPLTGGHHGANELAGELAGLGLQPVITTATEATGRDSVEHIADRAGCDIVNRDSTRLVNGALLDTDVPVHSVQGPSIVIAGPEVSILLKKGEFSVGIGCRRGVRADEVTGAVSQALADAGIEPGEVMVYATTAKKAGEAGLIEAVCSLSGNLIFLDDETLHRHTGVAPSKATKIGLPGVAEPSALAVSKRKELVLGKNVYGRVTIAIAR
ncbi:MAG TPA: cobalt-precorrin 5A hydrolase [Methanoregula sp.]|nr:cobalt-precorrin 5A hydrolase [Methanoregula sp.]